MVRKADVVDRMLMDEAEGFLLEHALFSPPRTWPPLPPAPVPAIAPPVRETRQRRPSDRLAKSKRRMDWDEEMASRKAGTEEEDRAFEALLSGAGSSRRRVLGEGVVIDDDEGSEDDANSERCVICLMALRDRTIVGVCGHEFCFECIGVWANQSRRCPLCSADMAPFLLHDLDNPTPTKFYLPPLPSRAVPTLTLPGPSVRNRRISDALRRDQALKEAADDLDEQVERRREIYQHELYVKHIASNKTTRFRPNPTPRQIADDPNLLQRATAFMRRELRVWSLVDVEFLTTYVLSLLKAIDIRSEPAIRLLAEFLDSPTGPGFPHGAEHFAHEIYSFLRSPFKELARWDAVAQYDPVPSADDDRSRAGSVSPVRDLPPGPKDEERSPARRRSDSRSPSPAHRRSRSPSRSRSRSYFPDSRHSRSRSPLRPRDPTRRDTYIPPELLDARKWYESDTWIDPDYQDWLDQRRAKAEERADRRRARRMAAMEADDLDLPPARMELLPSPPAAGTGGVLAMEEAAAAEEAGDDDDVLSIGEEELLGDIDAVGAGGLSIRGAAAPISRRLALLERLALAKAQATGMPPLPHSISDPLPGPVGGNAALRAKLRLRLKLESEKASLKHNQNVSLAQELRRRLLEARERRARHETDATLKQMDRLERAKEVRRRLMVAKMMAAETDGERKQRELKEKLVAERRRRMLREVLLARKRSLGAPGAPEGAAAVMVM